jgi:16S rRNA (cytosine1402-N4)-methyltransferase
MTVVSGEAVHISVLREESVEALRVDRGGIFLDCTFGGGGHTRALLDCHPQVHVVGIDRDARALARAQGWREKYGERLELFHGTFSHIEELVGVRRFEGVLADLGMSTDQLREGRGFSFTDGDSLDMRMNEAEGMTAQEFLNTASDRDLYLALVEGGIGKGARALVSSIQRARPITSAQHLADIVRGSSGAKRSESVHPATVVFQAIRMAVNKEREEIEGLLESIPHLIQPGGRFACITFHSIEDRLVTNRLREWDSGGSYPASWRGPREEKKLGTLMSKKPILPTESEVLRNPAARSARLRVFEFGSDFER